MQAAEKTTSLLRQFREQRGWSRQRLAHASHVSLSTIKKIELSGHRPKRPVAMALASALKCGVEDVFPAVEAAA